MSELQDKIDKKFLFQENRQLRLELKQCKQVIKAHKQAINNMSRIESKLQSKQSISCLTKLLLSERPTYKKFEDLAHQLHDIQQKQMFLEKMIEESEIQQKQTYHMVAEEYEKITKNNDELEKKLHDFYEKIGQVDYLSGLVTKYKSVITPNQQAIAFKKQQEQLLDFIAMQKDAIEKLSEQKSKLIKINIHMKDQVQKKKDDIRNMTVMFTNPDTMNFLNTSNNNGHPQQCEPMDNILQELQQQNQPSQNNNQPAQNIKPQINTSIMNMTSLNNTSLLNTTQQRNLNSTLNFIKMQRQIIKERTEEEELNSSLEYQFSEEQCEELNILFPDKVQAIKKNKETAKVPYLNMLKIREIMFKRDNKIRKGVEEQARHVNPTQKIIKLETELDITRKQLASQSLKYRTIQDDYRKCKRSIEQLENRNNFLLMANQRYVRNYKNIYRQFMWNRKVCSIIARYLPRKLYNIFKQCPKQQHIQIMNDQQSERNPQNQFLIQLQKQILQSNPSQQLQCLENQWKQKQKAQKKQIQQRISEILLRNSHSRISKRNRSYSTDN